MIKKGKHGSIRLSYKGVTRVSKKGSTFTERMHQLSRSELLEILLHPPTEELEKLVRKYLFIKFGMTGDQIKESIDKLRQKAESKMDIRRYAHGKKTPEEIGKKWGYSPETLYAATLDMYRFEIPAGRDAVRNQSVQQPLSSSNNLYYQFLKFKNDVITGKKSYQELENFLLDIANNHPEYARDIAYIIYSDKNKNSERKLVDVVTRRNLEKLKRDTQDKEYLTLDQKQKLVENDYHLFKKGDKSKFDSDLVGKPDEYIDSYRKRKKSRLVKRKTNKVKKPIRCRCK